MRYRKILFIYILIVLLLTIFLFLDAACLKQVEVPIVVESKKTSSLNVFGNILAYKYIVDVVPAGQVVKSINKDTGVFEFMTIPLSHYTTPVSVNKSAYNNLSSGDEALMKYSRTRITKVGFFRYSSH